MKKILFCLIFLFTICLFADEDKLFYDISWETSPEQVISIVGLPDKIYYSYEDEGRIFYDDNGNERRITVELVWINCAINDNDLLEYAVKNNIPIGNNLDTIVNNHNIIWFSYNNIQYFGFSSEVFLTFKNKELINILFIVDIMNNTNIEKQNISNDLQNYLLEYYGSPDSIYQYGMKSLFKWDLINTEITLDIFLPQSDPEYIEYRYVDIITIYYSYKKT